MGKGCQGGSRAQAPGRLAAVPSFPSLRTCPGDRPAQKPVQATGGQRPRGGKPPTRHQPPARGGNDQTSRETCSPPEGCEKQLIAVLVTIFLFFLILHYVFPRNKDILLHNARAISKIKILTMSPGGVAPLVSALSRFRVCSRVRAHTGSNQ